MCGHYRLVALLLFMDISYSSLPRHSYISCFLSVICFIDLLVKDKRAVGAISIQLSAVSGITRLLIQDQ